MAPGTIDEMSKEQDIQYNHLQAADSSNVLYAQMYTHSLVLEAVSLFIYVENHS